MPTQAQIDAFQRGFSRAVTELAKQASMTKQAGPLAGMGSRIFGSAPVQNGLKRLGGWASHADRPDWLRGALTGRGNTGLATSVEPALFRGKPLMGWQAPGMTNGLTNLDHGMTAAKRIGVGAGALGGTAAGVQGANNAVDSAKQRHMAQLGFGDRLGLALKFLSNPEAASRMLY